MLTIGPITEIPLPPAAGAVVDLAPVTVDGRPEWLVLDDTGRIGGWDLATGGYRHHATSTVPAAEGRQRHRLHAAWDGSFAAVVTDRGRWGAVVDLSTGRTTMTLDSGEYHARTVLFSLTFAEHAGRPVVVHRTDWNRLDVSVAGTGELLTPRPTLDRTNEHYLDYFHGALHLSPDGDRLLDDGWIWQPLGAPVVWSLGAWLGGNVWESEDGPTYAYFGDGHENWNVAMTWIDDVLIAVEHTEEDLPPGALVFDTTKTGEESYVARIPGAVGRYFSDGRHLLTVDADGLHVWDPRDGTRQTTVPGFAPTHHDRVNGMVLELRADWVALALTA